MNALAVHGLVLTAAPLLFVAAVPCYRTDISCFSITCGTGKVQIRVIVRVPVQNLL